MWGLHLPWLSRRMDTFLPGAAWLPGGLLQPQQSPLAHKQVLWAPCPKDRYLESLQVAPIQLYLERGERCQLWAKPEAKTWQGPQVRSLTPRAANLVLAAFV